MPIGLWHANCGTAGPPTMNADDEDDDLDIFQCIKDHDIESVQVR